MPTKTKPTKTKPTKTKSTPSAGATLRLPRRVEPGTPGQATYLRALRRCDLTICDGLAGTGKTFLAVARAIDDVRAEPAGPAAPRRTSIVICRPAVTAGEEHGFIPGRIERKVEPYLAPIMDALAEYLGDPDELRRLTQGESSVIRCVPLAYMRGRTFRDCWVLLDEAQNATPAQVEMFLSRQGPNCRVVLVGDSTQSDLLDPRGHPIPNGLAYAIARLEGRSFLRGRVGICRLGPEDILRSDFMAEVLAALRTPPEEGPADPPVRWGDVL